MSVSLSVGGTKLGSFAPKNPQNWTGIWAPAVTTTDESDIQSTVTVTFRSTGMEKAFLKSPQVARGLVPWKKDGLTATLNMDN